MAVDRWRLAPPQGPLTMPRPDADQQRVIDWSQGALMVVGAPGTGKTSTLAEAAVARILSGAAAARVLVIVRNRDEAKRLRSQVAQRLAEHEAPSVTTFHALALDIVTRCSDAAALPRLLSAAEQERAVRDIIDGTLEDDRLHSGWPESLRDAVRTRGFAREVRAAFAAARALGLAGDEVARMGRAAADDAWASIGPLLDAYLEAQDANGTYDYAELMFRAVVAVHDPALDRVLACFDHVYVDEYEETDPMQVALLRGIARTAQSLVVAGDPDAALYAFRGSEVTNIRDFSLDFATPAREVVVLSLSTGHRMPQTLQQYTNAVFGQVVPTVLPPAIAAVHRGPLPAPGEARVQASLYDDASAEAAHVAAAIRALAADGESGLDDIAVIARSSAALDVVERALGRAGVLCRIDVRNGPLVEQPAVRVLLAALRVVSQHQLVVDAPTAHELLLSPLCGLDPTELRALARTVRPDRLTPGDEALASALASERPLLEIDDATPGAKAFEALRLLLRRAHERVLAGATPHEALWVLWSGTAWPEQLQRRAMQRASALAHRDLDAVAELMDIAQRAVLRNHGRVGVAAFVYELLGQEVPADTLAQRGFIGPSVSLLTAHAAKGMQWKHVFVVGVTEGAWPNPRRRSALLDTDRLGTDALGAPRDLRSRFDEERRLFYVACSRASATLAVSGTLGERAADAQPSRFLANPTCPPVPRGGRPTAVHSAHRLIADLRLQATAAATPAALRMAAVERLRVLAGATDALGAPLFPEADPQRWWGTRDFTESAEPMVPLDAPLYVRGSSLDTLSKCSLNWFLQQRVQAEVPRSSAVVFGSAVHALAEGVVSGALPADQEVLVQLLREAWNDSGYDSAWQSERDFGEGVRAIARFLHWHGARSADRVAAEVEFARVIDVRTPSGALERLRMRGSIDRVEFADDGSVVVFDYKTGRSKAKVQDVDASGQLRYYQLAVHEGLIGEGLVPGGAALVHLRVDASTSDTRNPAVQEQPALRADDPWVTDVLGAGLALVRAEDFAATPGSHCEFCQMKPACPARAEGAVEPA